MISEYAHAQNCKFNVLRNSIYMKRSMHSACIRHCNIMNPHLNSSCIMYAATLYCFRQHRLKTFRSFFTSTPEQGNDNHVEMQTEYLFQSFVHHRTRDDSYQHYAHVSFRRLTNLRRALTCHISRQMLFLLEICTAMADRRSASEEFIYTFRILVYSSDDSA